jgi:hypothetical protein
LQTEEVRSQIASLNQIIEEKLGGPPENDSIQKYDLDDDVDPEVEDYITPEYVPVNKELQMPEADEWDSEAFDKYIATEVRLSKNGEEILGKVVARKRDHDGNPIGKANSNPILDTRLDKLYSLMGKLLNIVLMSLQNHCIHKLTVKETSSYC